MIESEILIVLPTLGERLETFRQTLNSVKQQQEEVSARLVVVLPKTANAAEEMAKTYGATIVHDPRKGISAAINAGIEARKNEKYYAWMGDDDLFRPGGLKTLQLIIEEASAVVAYGGCEYITPNNEVIAVSRAGQFATHILNWGPDLIPHPGSLMRIEEMVKVGLYDTTLKYVMDLDILLKLRKVGPFIGTKQVVSAFRWHPDSLTVANRKGSSDEAQAVKIKHLPRRSRFFARMIFPVVVFAAGVAAQQLNKRAKALDC